MCVKPRAHLAPSAAQSALAQSHRKDYSVALFSVSSLHPLLRAQNETNNTIHIPTTSPDQPL